MNEKNLKYELRAGQLVESLLKVLYGYSQAARHINGDSKFSFDPPFMKAGKEELVKLLLGRCMHHDAVKIFDHAFETKWKELAGLDEQQAISEGLKYLRMLNQKWQHMIRFAYRHKTYRDHGGYEVSCESRYDASLDLTFHPRTKSEIVHALKTLSHSFPLEFIRITYFKMGPFIVPDPDEENTLTCWHMESDSQEGTMIKWAVHSAEAYKFVTNNVLEHIAELLSAGATKIAVFTYHGRKPDDMNESAAA